MEGLVERRLGKPLAKGVPRDAREEMLALYREEYRIKYFHEYARHIQVVTVAASEPDRTAGAPMLDRKHAKVPVEKAASCCPSLRHLYGLHPNDLA